MVEWLPANRKVGDSIPGPTVPCQSVLGQDTEPRVAPDAAHRSVNVCKCLSDEQLAPCTAASATVCEW